MDPSVRAIYIASQAGNVNTHTQLNDAGALFASFGGAVVLLVILFAIFLCFFNEIADWINWRMFKKELDEEEDRENKSKRF